MGYLLEHGPNEQSIAKQSYMMGMPLPDFIANAPKLETGLQLFLQAFFDLDSERSHGMGVTSIPFSKIMDYAERFNLDEEDTEDMIFFVRQMDSDHTNRIAKKAKNGKKSK